MNNENVSNPVDDNRKIFIGGVPRNCDDLAFEEAFSQFGELEDIVHMRKPESKESRGFGFVTYKRKEDFDRVMKDGVTLNGRVLDLKVAVPRKEGDNRGPGRANTYRDYRQNNDAPIPDYSFYQRKNYHSDHSSRADYRRNQSSNPYDSHSYSSHSYANRPSNYNSDYRSQRQPARYSGRDDYRRSRDSAPGYGPVDSKNRFEDKIDRYRSPPLYGQNYSAHRRNYEDYSSNNNRHLQDSYRSSNNRYHQGNFRGSDTSRNNEDGYSSRYSGDKRYQKDFERGMYQRRKNYENPVKEYSSRREGDFNHYKSSSRQNRRYYEN